MLRRTGSALLLAGLLLGAGACEGSVHVGDCGDGDLDGDEQCDQGRANGTPCAPPLGGECRYCDAGCRWVTVSSPPACSEGAVAGECVCGTATVDSGYCCAGVPGDAPCPSCEDGVQNQGETGVDCGGPCPACDPPADFYLSAQGDDGADGRTPETAWRSLGKLEAELAQVAPGQRIAFRRGDEFHGSLRIGRPGAAGSPITLGAYGAGPRPVLTGLARVSGWTAAGSGVYAQVVPCASPPEVVLVDGVQRPMGRWPDEGGWAHYEAHVGRTAITDHELGAAPDWTGAELVLRANEWAIGRNPITAHAGSTITFTNTLPDTPDYALKDGWGYFVQNSRAALDAFGEFYYDPGTSTLYVHFGAEDPGAHRVEVSTVDTVIALDPSADHITLEDLAVRGGNASSLHGDRSDFLTVRRCELLFSGLYGIRLGGAEDCAILDTEIGHSNDKGIYAYSGSHRLHVAGCTVRDTGAFAGLGLSSTQAHIGIVASRGDDLLIEHNQILRSGYSGINHSSNRGVIRHNLIDTYCFTMVDGGGIYYGSQTAVGDITITGNIVLNGLGAPGGLPPGRPLSAANGIYVDYNTLNGVAVTGNTVAHCVGGGIFVHESQNIEIAGNTVYNCRQAMRFQDSGLGVTIRDITMTGNVFAARGADQPTLWARTSDATNDFDLWGAFDENCYVRPIDDERSIQAMVSVWSDAPLSLAEWQALSGQDAHSRTSPLALPPYVVGALLGENLFPGGSFDAGIDGVACWNDAGNCALSHDGAALDGGALAVSFDAQVPSANSLLTLGIGAVSADRDYVLRFSLLAEVDPGSRYRVFLRKRGDPWTVLSAVDEAPFAAGRVEREVLFATPIAEADAVIVLSVPAAASTSSRLWLDNVELHEAEVSLTDPDAHLRLEYNATRSERIVPLDGTYLDARGGVREGALTLAPFTSILLIRE